MDCNICKEKQKQVEPVTYFVFESVKATMERTIRRLWILSLVLIALLFGTNAAWVYYESQWEDVVVEQEVDTGEGDAFVAGVGDINYGKSKTDNQNPETQDWLS